MSSASSFRLTLYSPPSCSVPWEGDLFGPHKIVPLSVAFGIVLPVKEEALGKEKSEGRRVSAKFLFPTSILMGFQSVDMSHDQRSHFLWGSTKASPSQDSGNSSSFCTTCIGVVTPTDIKPRELHCPIVSLAHTFVNNPCIKIFSNYPI